VAQYTVRYATFRDGASFVVLTYDDSQMRVRSVSGTNGDVVPLTFLAIRDSDGNTWSTTIAPGQTASRNLPPNTVTLELDVDPETGETNVRVQGWTLTCTLAG
jgi:hypothetical protein